MESQNKIVFFEGANIRQVWHNNKWYFAINDIIESLTGSSNVKQYIKKLRSRDPELASNWGTICTPLRMPTFDGKIREINAADTEGVLRIIISVPSPKAEPFKKWLTQVGSERINETENPELAIERVREIYLAKGYKKDWVDLRIKSIDIRKGLTEEWKNRGVKDGQEYSILTAEIAKATFGLTPSEHKTLKGLAHHNLRDHMSNLELIFSMLGEEATKQIAVREDAKGFQENQDAAIQGGRIAGKARKNAEKDGLTVVSAENFLNQIKENTEGKENLLE